MTCNPNIKDKKAVWSVEEVTDARCKIYFYGVHMFNATFNTISVISWQSVLLVEETGVLEENH